MSAGTVLFVTAVVLLLLGLITINALKGKPGMALLGFVIHICWFVGALRLAKPRSWWARRFYVGANADKLQRAEKRHAGRPAARAAPWPVAPPEAAPVCTGSQRKPHAPTSTIPVEDPDEATYRCPICGREQRPAQDGESPPTATAAGHGQASESTDPEPITDALPAVAGGAYAGAPRGRRHSRRLVVLSLSVLLILGALVGGWLVYRSRGQGAFNDGHRAYAQYDCKTAASKLHHVSHFYRFSFATYVGVAKSEEDQCRTIRSAQDEAASGSYSLGTSTLEALLKRYGTLPIEDRINTDLIHWYLTWGKQTLAGASTPGEYLAAAHEIEGAYGHGGPYPPIDAAMGQVWRAVMGGGACKRVPDLDAVAAAEFTSSRGRDMASTAVRLLPANMLSCAKTEFAARHYGVAVAQLQLLKDRYPNSPQARVAAPLLIDAQVAAIRRGQTGNLPSPQPTGTTNYGETSVAIGNDSPRPIELLLSGPSSKRLYVRACLSCKEYNSTPSSYTCDSSTPSASIVLTPGTYDVVARSPHSKVEPFSGSWSLGSGESYDHCFFIVSTPISGGG